MQTGSIYWNFWQEFKNGNRASVPIWAYTFHWTHQILPSHRYRTGNPKYKGKNKILCKFADNRVSHAAEHKLDYFMCPVYKIRFPVSCVYICRFFFAEVFQTKIKIKTTSEPFPASLTSTHIKLMKGIFIPKLCQRITCEYFKSQFWYIVLFLAISDTKQMCSGRKKREVRGKGSWQIQLL